MIALVKDMQSLPGTGAAVPSGDGGGEPIRLRQSLELRNVGFSYEGSERTVIDDLSLVIRANTTVGFVGSTGAGKTTIVDIILGVLEPVRGEMLVDGTRVDGSNVRRWQRTLGYVPQDIFLIDDTVRANVAFGVPPDQIDDAAVERAARMAKLHDFVVTELPGGYDTQIGERGVRLSGGQRQRVAIARALYRDPDLLVLDEATSALDTETERAVMDAVHNLAQAKTIILIAHRLSTVRECDCIYLLDRGRIAGSGTYDQLVDQNAKFRALAGHRA
jgi:ABC-type multidrug transport system fused ATPase/permease subunit